MTTTPLSDAAAIKGSAFFDKKLNSIEHLVTGHACREIELKLRRRAERAEAEVERLRGLCKQRGEKIDELETKLES